MVAPEENMDICTEFNDIATESQKRQPAALPNFLL